MMDPAFLRLFCAAAILTIGAWASAHAQNQAPPAKQTPDAGQARAAAIRERFTTNIEEMHAAIAAEIDAVAAVAFDLSPMLLLPGEETALTIQARSETPPNGLIEVWRNCYVQQPEIHQFQLEWKEEAPGSWLAVWQWRPPACGNYLVHWVSGVPGDIPDFWRNFSVVDQGWAVMVLNSTSHAQPKPQPDFHRFHLPFSYWQEALLYHPYPTPENFLAFSRNSRQYGDDPGLMIFLGGEYEEGDKTVFYDESEIVQRTVLECYQDFWRFCRFPAPLNSLYTYGMGNGPVRAARDLGLDLIGALCADQNWGDGPFKINHWGMPARPYFMSEEDFRKPGPGGPGAMVGVQQCERQTALCRDYGCVYSFESGIAYAFDQYSGITRPRIVNEMILSREMSFFDCFLEAASQCPQPYLFSCGIEMNGVWPEMADINRQFMALLARRAATRDLAVTTASAAADFMRRQYQRIPESTLYLPDVFAGMVHGEKPPLYPDTMEVENARFRAIFRSGETLPYAQYDYTEPWDYPDWGNEDIPRKPDGYAIPNTEDRFRATPRILDTRSFSATLKTQETGAATKLVIEIEAETPCKDLALAVWNIPRTFSQDPSSWRLSGAKRFIPVRAPFTANFNGIIEANIHPGRNRIRLAINTPARPPATLDYRIPGPAKAKVFPREKDLIAYLFAEGSQAAEISCQASPEASVTHYPFDSDEPRTLTGTRAIRLEPGRPQRILFPNRTAFEQAFPGASPLFDWGPALALPPSADGS